MTDIGSARDFSEGGTLRRFEPVRSQGTDTSGQPAVPEDLLTLGQIKSKIVASEKKVTKSEIRYSRVRRPNVVPEISSEKNGWVFTGDMLARAPFAKLFATGPDDPLRIKHYVYCMLFEQNVKMAARGITELRRCFQQEYLLRLDQRSRERSFPKDVRGPDAHALYGERRENEKKLYIEYEVPELDNKRPCFYDVIEGKPFTFTMEKDRVSIPFQLMMTFSESGGELWGLKDYWTQVGVLTGHSASLADFAN